MSFSIGEFSELVGIPSSTLRFYEKEGLITPDRDKNNLRTYSEEDANWLKFLLHLKGAGLSVEELKQYTIWRAAGDSTISERLNMLKRRRLFWSKRLKTCRRIWIQWLGRLGFMRRRLRLDEFS